MITAIVLAAGDSKRMGEQKLLLPLGKETVIATVVDAVLASPLAEVLVVVRQDRPGIERALEGRPVKFVDNRDSQGDMLSSLRCGLRAMSAADAVLVVLGDQPGISGAVVADLVRAFEAGAAPIIAPTFRGKRGHPLLFSSHYREEVLHCFDDVGLRGLLQAHADDVCEIEVSSPEVLENMNSPGDYRRIREAYLRRDGPGRSTDIS